MHYRGTFNGLARRFNHEKAEMDEKDGATFAPRSVERGHGTVATCSKCGLALLSKNPENINKYCPQCEERLKIEHAGTYSLVRKALESSGFGKESEGLISTQHLRAEREDAARDTEGGFLEKEAGIPGTPPDDSAIG